MKTFKQFFSEAGSFGYSSASWRYYVADEKGKSVSDKFHEKSHEAEREMKTDHADKKNLKVRKVRW